MLEGRDSQPGNVYDQMLQHFEVHGKRQDHHEARDTKYN